MTIRDFIGKEFDSPIKSSTTRAMHGNWHKPQAKRLRHQTLTATDGATLSYTLLYYIPGLATICNLVGEPVITGYMSGCFLFRYRSRGVLRAAHVGTDLEHPNLDRKVKATWNAYIARPHVTDVYGFDPTRDFSDDLYSKAVGERAARFIGIFDTSGVSYIGLLAEAGNAVGKQVLLGIEPAPMRPWAAIMHSPKFN